MLKAPAHLGPDGRTLWRSIVADYAISDSAGLVLVATVCECLDRLRQAQVLIAEHGACIVGEDGSVRTNPASKVEVDARNGLASALKSLNLDLEPFRDHPGRPAGSYGNGRGHTHSN